MRPSLPTRALLAILSLGLIAALLSPAAGSTSVLAHPGGAVVITFDDGCTSALDAATDLEARGMRGTFFVIAGQAPPDAACQTYLDATQVAALSARGHDIESHTVTHPHLETLSDDALRHQLVDSRARLEQITGKPILHLAYPYGEAPARVEAAAAGVYATARWYYRDVPSMPLGTTDSFAVPAIGIENSTTREQANGYVDLAASQGVTIVLVFHDISASPSQFDATRQQLDDVLDHVVAAGLPVLTYAQVFPGVTFQEKGGNEWWTQVALSGPDAARVAKVESADDGGPWVTLTKRSWGDYAGSYHVEPGHRVTFRATMADGRQLSSCAFSHPADVCSGTAVSTPPPSPSPSPPPPPPAGAFRATFGHARGNAWWIESDVTVTGGTLAGVDARVDGGAWAALGRTSWGSWAASVRAPAGSHVELRAKAADGQAFVAPAMAWPPG